MNIISKINKSLAERIDSIVYTTDKKTFKVSNQLTIDWANVLPESPKNSSNETKKELKYLADITENLSVSQKNLVYLVDKEPLDLYNDILRRHGLKMPRDKFNKVWNITRPIIMNLKHKFNRPRPEQLAKFYGLNINVTETKTHQTPAYPSGHTAYCAVGAYILSDLYPEHSSEFFGKIGDAGFARCLQGVHYPSDNEAAMVITGAIWQNIRYKIFPEIKPFRVD
jgi:hypothetical protein